ncbi:hypothetical protein K491DRAFT_694591 [Lophiostoma macrostomum CBS 122681]|uniref:Uncharacterized protein n=1 Tax=Lophiostoma macrostomum CBS 122681 TaxID=1314788 RepID=A0A6A6T0I5_9PLEO|nr:hypothetical protein K491DRAFT_694591 [Lophiostoma macrostomum CBS 122681]
MSSFGGSLVPTRTGSEKGVELLRYFEAWEDDSGLQIRSGSLRTSAVDPDELEDWLDLRARYEISSREKRSIAPVDMILRVIACDVDRYNLFQPGCGTDDFDSIVEAFDLHGTTGEVFWNNNGAFARYFSSKPGSLEPSSFALMFKVPNCVNIGYDALSMSYDLKRRRSRVFLHGIGETDFETLAHYLRGVKDEKTLYLQPMLVATHIFAGHRTSAESFRTDVDDNLHATEIDIGYATPGFLRGRQPKRRAVPHPKNNFPPKDLDLEQIVRYLHSCLTELAAVALVASDGTELGLFLQKTARELDSFYSKTRDVDFLRHSKAVTQYIEAQTNLFSSMLAQTELLDKRVHTDLDLSLNLTAQEENRISRAIAEESFIVALATWRDSAAMRTIAYVTLIFLPPTFVATLFSMTFFDWSPEPPNTRIIAKHFWIYWVVSVPLTVVVWIIWRLWWTREEESYRRELLQLRQVKGRGVRGRS